MVGERFEHFEESFVAICFAYLLDLLFVGYLSRRFYDGASYGDLLVLALLPNLCDCFFFTLVSRLEGAYLFFFWRF